ncbi:MAG: hypothetical protein HZA22_11755 [Nitrospirae bacterium]|nr:hypothetical protein [Nitrospirota bacterium]MBI5696469.1 hypothetical protein [Nitrospirota bacterium]
MKTIIYILIIALVLSLRSPAIAGPVGDIRVFVPESLTSVSTENPSLSGPRRTASMAVVSTTGKKVSVVGKVDGKDVQVELNNNGRSRTIPNMRDGHFHAQVTLSLGVNLLEVRWRKGDGQWESKTLSIFRSSKLEGGLASTYPPYVFHKDENEEHCQECHRTTLTQAEIETGMEKSCLRCHKGLTDNLNVHGPVAVGICTVCHDPGSEPNRYRVEERDTVLCYGCHTDRKEIDDSKLLLHGPVGAGMCTICHDAHSTPFPFQLIKAKSEICIMCHQEDADRWNTQNSLHPPFKSGNCSGCHDPHSSDFKYNLKANRAEICGLCHEIPVPGHLHMVGHEPQFTLPADFPMTDDGKTMCLTCHDPHGAPGAHLTRREGCDGCHPK